MVMGVCSELPSSRLHCEASNHICFYSKQSGADTAGSFSLLLKAFWGLLRDGPDGVIYPLFAEWTRIECDVYGQGIPISHPCQGHLPRRTDESRQGSATAWAHCALHPLFRSAISLRRLANASFYLTQRAFCYSKPKDIKAKTVVTGSATMYHVVCLCQ